MVFRKTTDSSGEQLLAVGDAHGHLHVLMIPKNLVRQAGKELDNMRKFLDREEQRVKYFQDRRVELAEMRERDDKLQQMGIDKEAEKDATKPAVDDKRMELEEKADAQAEEIYQ